ncbi:LINE-1 retrotransposable element ORF2 protein [Bienertia sinuspersici]
MVDGQQDEETFVAPQFHAPFNLLSVYKAALRGDWDAATQICSKHLECFITRIAKQGDTTLHIVALARRTDFVVQLVTVVAKDCRDNLALKKNNENTALFLATASRSVEIARVMVDVHNEVPMIRGNDGLTPLHMAALLGHREMGLGEGNLWSHPKEEKRLLARLSRGQMALEDNPSSPFLYNLVQDLREQFQELLNQEDCLFSSQYPNIPHPTTGYNQTIHCSLPPSLEEIHEVTFNLKALKAPGPDGFHAYFFQKHWDTIKLDLLSFIKSIFHSKSIPPQINQITITLIPKCENPNSIK